MQIVGEKMRRRACCPQECSHHCSQAELPPRPCSEPCMEHSKQTPELQPPSNAKVSRKHSEPSCIMHQLGPLKLFSTKGHRKECWALRRKQRECKRIYIILRFPCCPGNKGPQHPVKAQEGCSSFSRRRSNRCSCERSQQKGFTETARRGWSKHINTINTQPILKYLNSSLDANVSSINSCTEYLGSNMWEIFALKCPNLSTEQILPLPIPQSDLLQEEELKQHKTKSSTAMRLPI